MGGNSYNEQAASFKERYEHKPKDDRPTLDEFVDNDPQKISWSVNLKADVVRFHIRKFQYKSVVKAIYRPFTKLSDYHDRNFVERVLQMPKVCTQEGLSNLAICVVGSGARQDFAALVVDTLPDVHLAQDGAQCFPLF